MSTDTRSASRMGTAPMGPLLFSLAIPMMVSMLFQALYNVVDSIFVSYINEAALSAVSLAFPIQNLMIAFAVGTGVGVPRLTAPPPTDCFWPCAPLWPSSCSDWWGYRPS